MALVDVSDLLADPDFADDITVIRSSRSVDSTGRTVDAPTQLFIYGNVQPAPESQLAQIPEAERVESYISVVTPFGLQALTDITAPDRLIWNDKTYQVWRLRDWTNYGNGFVEAICALISMTGADGL